MLQVHERLGDFEIIRLLGKGGMGEVYEARQSNLDRPVALKVLNDRLARDDDSLKRFFREAEVPGKLDHPGIVRIITTGKTPDGIAYFAMHLVRGISLSEMIRRANASQVSDAPTRTVESVNTPSAAAPPSSDHAPQSPLPAAESIPPLMQDYRHDRFMAVARIGAQAARALAYAHAQGYLHRDIKPSNLMVDMHNQVYLVDFGLTRGLEPTADSTQPGTLVGTPWYMSPEQADIKSVDARSDIYSLGVTLYELATQGLGPFTAARDDRSAVLTQVRAGQALPLRTLATGIPPVLEQIILRAMEHKPKRRYASVAEMAHDLEAFCGHSSRPSSRPIVKTMARGPRLTWPVMVGTLLLAAAAIPVALLVAAMVRSDSRVEPPVESAKLDGTKALPVSLQDKTNLNAPVYLLDQNSAPRWSNLLFGTLKPSPVGDHCALPADTILALADPDRRNFEFAIQLAAATKGADYGIFLGWRRRDQYSTNPYRFFLIKFECSIEEEGKVTIGTSTLRQGNESLNPAVLEPFTPLRLGKASETIPTWHPLKGWPEIKVEVRGDDVTVSVPQRQPPLSFTLSELKRSEPVAYKDMTTHGAVGVWCKQGVALFKGAKVTPLPD